MVPDQSQRVWAKLMLIGKLLEGFVLSVGCFFKGMNPQNAIDQNIWRRVHGLGSQD